MSSADICKILGLFLFILAAVLVIPLMIAIYYQYFVNPELHPQPHSTIYFLETIVICLAIASTLYVKGRNASGNLLKKETVLVVVIAWFLTPLIGALPFYLSGTLSNPCGAYFESVSGFTSTGASTIQAKRYDPTTGAEIPYRRTIGDLRQTEYVFYGTIEPVRDPKNHKIVSEGIEAAGKAILFWRSLTNWLGGIGIIVLLVAVLPVQGVSGKGLFQLEFSGPVKEAVSPRIRDTAMQLWLIYFGLTILQVILLMATNHAMEFFDAVTVSFSTISTGGFSIRDESIGYYHNPMTEWVVIIFMLLGSINFSLYIYLFRGRIYKFFSSELICFFVIFLCLCALSAWYLIGQPNISLADQNNGPFSIGEAIRYGFFQVTSCLSSTGFVTANYDAWPFIVQGIMLLAMWIGGMSGSTASGIKTIRHMMLFRIVQAKVESIFRPGRVSQLNVNQMQVDYSGILSVLCFFVVIVAASVLGLFLFLLDGIDPETALSLVAATVNNAGCGFRAAGPTESFAFLSDFGLALSSILMILGRLEFFSVLALMVPSFWKRSY